MVSTVIPVQPFDLVIFGATGDLSHRKILPSLYRRLAVHQMPSGSRIIGAARSKMTKLEFRKTVRDSLAEFVDAKYQKPELIEEFLNCIDYVADRRRRRGRLGHAGEAPRREAEPHPRLLPLGRAAALRDHRRAAGAGRHRHVREPHRRREAARPRPRLGAGAERRARASTSPSTRSTGSTTTSGRRPSRT